MTLDLMREYIVFAKHLNFSHAARELNLTQSTLSKHIAALEKELGFPVVTRGRELRFTAQGKAFLESAQKVVHLYDAEIVSLRESFALRAGPVRLYEGMVRWTELLNSINDIPIAIAAMTGSSSPLWTASLSERPWRSIIARMSQTLMSRVLSCAPENSSTLLDRNKGALRGIAATLLRRGGEAKGLK